jgi:hypothetical protein
MSPVWQTLQVRAMRYLFRRYVRVVITTVIPKQLVTVPSGECVNTILSRVVQCPRVPGTGCYLCSIVLTFFLWERIKYRPYVPLIRIKNPALGSSSS